MNRNKEFAKNLCLEMEKSHISIKELSQKSGITQAGISQYRHGQVFPKPETLKALASALGVTADKLADEIPKEVLAKGGNIPVKVAAHYLGISASLLRKGIENGNLPVGYAIKSGHKNSYIITTHTLSKVTGSKIAEMAERKALELAEVC